MNDDITQLKQQVQELMAWKAAREKQQLVYPFDDTSRLVLRAITAAGFGSKGTTASIGSVPATVVKLPAGTVILDTPDGQFEVPYY